MKNMNFEAAINTGSDIRKSNLKISDSDIVLFANQLAIMLESGVVLSDAIEAIALQNRPGPLRSILSDIGEMIKSGRSFSEALSCYPKAFDSMFISMVNASELSGRMSEMLEVLTSYLNAEIETKKQLKGAMIYPLVMLLMAVSATGSLMFFVLPRFTRIYESRGASLPALTQLLVKCSQTISNPGFMAGLVTFLVAVYIFFGMWKNTLAGQKLIDSVRVRTPIIGTMFVDAILTRSMRIMSSMVNKGVSLLDTFKVMQNNCENVHFKELWKYVDSRIRDGYQFSDAIVMAPGGNLISPSVLQMLKAGEKSGKLGYVCGKASDFYERKLQNTIKIVTSLIEPVMIIIMGGIIGTIAIALLLPVFRISSVLAH